MEGHAIALWWSTVYHAVARCRANRDRVLAQFFVWRWRSGGEIPAVSL